MDFFPLLNPTRWENSPKSVLIILKRQRVEIPNTDPHARAVFRESITTGEVRSNLPSRLVFFGALMPIARLHSTPLSIGKSAGLSLALLKHECLRLRLQHLLPSLATHFRHKDTEITMLHLLTHVFYHCLLPRGPLRAERSVSRLDGPA
jgi:hypothetical protein